MPEDFKYDMQYASNLYRNKDYSTLADYEEWAATMYEASKNNEEQDASLVRARQLRRMSRERQAKLDAVKSLGQHRLDAYLFSEAIRDKTTLPDNGYTTKFKGELKNLSGEYEYDVQQGNLGGIRPVANIRYDKPIYENKDGNINIRFDSEKKYKRFLENSGFEGNRSFANTGATTSVQPDGTVRVTVNPSNSEISNILLGLTQGLGPFDDDFDLVHDDWKTEIRGNYSAGLRNLSTMINNANSIADEVESNIDAFDQDLVIYPAYRSVTDMKLQRMLNRGQIKASDFKTIQDQETARVENTVKSANFADYEIYAYGWAGEDDGGKLYQRVTDTKAKLALENLVKGRKFGSNEGEMMINLACMNGVMGWQISIPKSYTYKDGKEVKFEKIYDLFHPNENNALSLFIPNIDNSDDAMIADLDPALQAQRDMASMFAYQYENELVDGTVIYPTENREVFIKQDKDTGERTQINYQTAHNELVRSSMMQQAFVDVKSFKNHQQHKGVNIVTDSAAKQLQSREDSELESRIYIRAAMLAKDITGTTEGPAFDAEVLKQVEYLSKSLGFKNWSTRIE